jgi:hypothetical protein
MGNRTIPINKKNLKILTLRLMMSWEPEYKHILKSNTLIQWVKETYWPADLDRFVLTSYSIEIVVVMPAFWN